MVERQAPPFPGQFRTKRMQLMPQMTLEVHLQHVSSFLGQFEMERTRPMPQMTLEVLVG
jgi:hypothetical protein